MSVKAGLAAAEQGGGRAPRHRLLLDGGSRSLWRCHTGSLPSCECVPMRSSHPYCLCSPIFPHLTQFLAWQLHPGCHTPCDDELLSALSAPVVPQQSLGSFSLAQHPWATAGQWSWAHQPDSLSLPGCLGAGQHPPVWTKVSEVVSKALQGLSPGRDRSSQPGGALPALLGQAGWAGPIISARGTGVDTSQWFPWEQPPVVSPW